MTLPIDILEYARKRAENIENYIACYLLYTGFKPDQITLIEKRSEDGLQIEWYCKPKDDAMRPRRTR